MRAPHRIDDALERHLAMLARADCSRPPAPVSEALASYDALAFDPGDSPYDALLAYTREVDAPAHPGAPERNAATLAALAPERFSLVPDAIDRWMGTLLSLTGPAPVRVHDAFAHEGAHRYAVPPGGVRALWDARRASWALIAHPCVRGAVAYFDAMYLHPYDDGNARLARALFTRALCEAPGRSLAETHRAAVDLRALVWLPKTPGSEESLWRFVLVAARGAVARARSRGPGGCARRAERRPPR